MLYENARDFFESVRESSRDIVSCKLQLLGIEEGCGSGSGMRINPGSVKNPMDRVANAMDAKARLESRIESGEKIIERAQAVLYGRDNDAGVARLLGDVSADVVWWYYVACLPWSKVGQVVGYSERRCRQLRDVVFDTVDAYGIGAIIAGEGMAE